MRNWQKDQKITSLDELMQQQTIIFIPSNKVYHIGWFSGWQLHLAIRWIKNGYLYTVKPFKKDGDSDGS